MYARIQMYRGWKIGHAIEGWYVERWGVRLNVNNPEHGRRRIDERAKEYPWEVDPDPRS